MMWLYTEIPKRTARAITTREELAAEIARQRAEREAKEAADAGMEVPEWLDNSD